MKTYALAFTIITTIFVAIAPLCYADSEDLSPDVWKKVTINGIGYYLSDDDMVAHVFVGEHSASHLVIPEYVKYRSKTYTVSDILPCSFQYNQDVISVTIPKTVKTVGEYAFSSCKNLESVIFPDSLDELGVGAFWCAYKLKSIKLSDGIRIIRKTTFDSCISLTEITIPQSVDKIEKYAFAACHNLVKINILNPNTRIHVDAVTNPKVQIIGWNGETYKGK